MARSAFVILFALAVTFAQACSGGSDGGSDPVAPPPVNPPPPPPPQLEGRWLPAAAAPSARWWGGSVVLGDHIYVAGGLVGDGFTDTSEFSRYSMAADTWETLDPIPLDLAHAPLVTLDGLIYLVGGIVEVGGQPPFAVSSLWVYDPTTEEWSAGPNLPIPVGSGGAATDGAKIYVVGGGTTGSQAISQTFIFDPAEQTWTTGADMPQATTGHAVVGLGGLIYAIGGFQLAEATSSVVVYDPASDTWASRAPMPSLRVGFTAAVLQDRIHLIGGRRPSVVGASGVTARHDAYDPATNTWTQFVDLPAPRNNPTSGGDAGRIWVIGGHDGSNGSTTVAVFDDP